MRIVVAGIAAFLLAAGLVLFSQWSSNPARSNRVVPEVESTYSESAPRMNPGDSDAGGTAPPGGDPGSTESARESRPLNVAVRAKGTSAPIAGALVSLVRPRSAGEELAFVPRLDVSAEATTKDDGSCALAVTEPWDHLCVAVSAEGYLPGRFDLPVPLPDEAAIDLEPGGVVEGRVVDPSGRPVPDVRVMFGTAVLPRRFASRTVSDSARTAWAAAWSDENGRFTCSGLPDARLRLEVSADGWLLQKLGFGGGAKRNGLIPVGTDDVQITMTPVRVFRLRLKDARHGVPVAASVVQIDVLPTEYIKKSALYSALPAEPMRVWPRGGSDELIELCSPSDPPGTTVGRVLLKGAAEVPAQARIMIDARGYRHCVTSATLRLPSELPGGSGADEIELEPSEMFEAADLVVHDARPMEGLWRPPFRVATVVRTADGLSVFRRGRLQRDGEWLFEALPAGECKITVFDGISMSEESEVQLTPGAPVEIRPEFPPPVGVALRLRDPEGRRLFDADTIGVLAAEGTRSSMPPLSISRFRLHDDAVVHGFQPLPPGRYRLFVMKSGFKRKLEPFEIREGGATFVDLRLEPDPR